MPPPEEDTSRVKEGKDYFDDCQIRAQNVIVFFDDCQKRHFLEMKLKISIRPPNFVRWSFSTIVHYKKDKTKRETTVYFEVSRRHILSLTPTHQYPTVVAGIDSKTILKLRHPLMLIELQLESPGDLITPEEFISFPQSFKRHSQKKMDFMASLAKQQKQKFSVIASCRHLSPTNTRLLQNVLTSRPYERDKEKREDDVRLPTLYSGQGGHKYTTHISSIPEIDDMASESGESTIATDTPPPYMEASASGDEISAASPPPYQSCTLQDSDQVAGAKRKRRRHDEFGDDDVDQNSSLRPFSESSNFSSKLQQIERLLIVTIQRQDKQDSQLADLKKRLDDLEELQAVIEEHQADIEGRQADIEGRQDEIDGRQDEIDGRQDEIDGRQDEIEEKYDVYDINVHDEIVEKVDDKLAPLKEGLENISQTLQRAVREL